LAVPLWKISSDRSHKQCEPDVSHFPEATPSTSGEERFAFVQEAKPSGLEPRRLWRFRLFYFRNVCQWSDTATYPLPHLHIHTDEFILFAMSVVRKTISLPPAVAERLNREAKRRRTSVSALVSELVQKRPEQLPYAALIEDDQDLSDRVEEILARLSH